MGVGVGWGSNSSCFHFLRSIKQDNCNKETRQVAVFGEHTANTEGGKLIYNKASISSKLRNTFAEHIPHTLR